LVNVRADQGSAIAPGVRVVLELATVQAVQGSEIDQAVRVGRESATVRESGIVPVVPGLVIGQAVRAVPELATVRAAREIVPVTDTDPVGPIARVAPGTGITAAGTGIGIIGLDGPRRGQWPA
jgi:hypothetical protein